MGTPLYHPGNVNGAVPGRPRYLKSCNYVGNPGNGHAYFNAPLRTVGSKVTYSCNPAYALNGLRVRTCQSDQTWSGSPPTCTSKRRFDFFFSHCYRCTSTTPWVTLSTLRVWRAKNFTLFNDVCLACLVSQCPPPPPTFTKMCLLCLKCTI